MRHAKRIWITGSSDGLGLLGARELVQAGHRVVLHARNKARAEQALKQVPGAENVFIGDLSQMEEIVHLAEIANQTGRFDVVIHNAGVYQASPKDIGFVNLLAPYVLTCLMHRPERLIYLSSDLHQQGKAHPEKLSSELNQISYADSKLYVLMLCMAVARHWPDVLSNAVNPGWVPTKMGGRHAPDDLKKGYETQIWLATSEEREAKISGKYFFHRKPQPFHPDAGNEALQEELLKQCAKLTGICFSKNKNTNQTK
ncbi:MAG: SDR family NAD(P)-dependent oxidoreductase [Thermoflavifilum aggregans]|nr:SDR family NAD(P)-dependent oxidoreductase [Thermoflavifilum aggregans]